MHPRPHNLKLLYPLRSPIVGVELGNVSGHVDIALTLENDGEGKLRVRDTDVATTLLRICADTEHEIGYLTDGVFAWNLAFDDYTPDQVIDEDGVLHDIRSER